MGDGKEDIKTLKAMIEADPQNRSLYYRLEWLQLCSCDWRGVSETINRVVEVAPAEETEAIVGSGRRAVLKLCAGLGVLFVLGWVFRALLRASLQDN